MRCVVCGAEAGRRVRYDRHVVLGSVRALAQAVLPAVDFLIPASFATLKRASNRSPLFGGYVRICASCGHGTMERPPTAEELTRYYQETYWSNRLGVVAAGTGAGEDHRARHQVGLVLKHVDCRSISAVLEIGAGAARASLLLRERCDPADVALYVCEPGTQWAEHYERRGIVHLADYFPFDTELRFDHVHTSHWLEHVVDLPGTVADVGRMVRPGGTVFVEVPNTEHFYWDVPELDTPHIHFFTRQSLARVFEDHGFEGLGIGEFGLTYLDRQRGRHVTPDDYGPREKGFWIRALFRRRA